MDLTAAGMLPFSRQKRLLKGVIFNDAGVGKDKAGIAGLSILEYFGIAGTCVSYVTARIGNGDDGYNSGIISWANEVACRANVRVRLSAKEAAHAFTISDPANNALKDAPSSAAPSQRPTTLIARYQLPVFCVDSISQVENTHRGAVIVAGSHGGIVAGNAVRVPVGGALFNDAGGGKDEVRYTRLLLLDSQNIPAATVSHLTARIGDGIDS